MSICYHAIAFERMAAEENKPEVRAQFEAQAAAYRKLAAERAARYGLKAPPTADIKDQQMIKVSLANLNVVNHFGQTLPVLDPQTAFAFVAIGPDNRELMKLGIGCDYHRLILD